MQQRGFDEGIDLRALGHIERVDPHFGALLAQFVGKRLQAIHAAGTEDQARARLCEGAGDAGTDAAGGAGDQDGSGKAHGGVL